MFSTEIIVSPESGVPFRAAVAGLLPLIADHTRLFIQGLWDLDNREMI
jgi:hypothetical protein